MRAAGLEAFRTNIIAIVPAFTDRVTEIGHWDDVQVLSVRVDRPCRWYRPGLLCLGDAAHAMSPAGADGINLAIQDAVAAANTLGPAFEKGAPTRSRPTPHPASTPATDPPHPGCSDANDAWSASQEPAPRPLRAPTAGLRLFRLLPPLRYLTGYFIGQGFRPEHLRS